MAATPGDEAEKKTKEKLWADYEKMKLAIREGRVDELRQRLQGLTPDEKTEILQMKSQAHPHETTAGLSRSHALLSRWNALAACRDLDGALFTRQPVSIHVRTANGSSLRQTAGFFLALSFYRSGGGRVDMMDVLMDHAPKSLDLLRLTGYVGSGLPLQLPSCHEGKSPVALLDVSAWIHTPP